MFLSKILMHLSLITRYIVEENIFVVIAYKLLVQKKILKYHVKDCFRINVKQMTKMPNKVNTSDLQIMEEK